MPSLLDIAPPEIATERIGIRDTELEVRGLRNREWAKLLRRFPLLRQQVAGVPIDPEETVVASIEIMPAVIVAGVMGEDRLTEDNLDEWLSDAEQAEVFAAIMRLTNPPPPLAESPAAQAGQEPNGKATTS